MVAAAAIAGRAAAGCGPPRFFDQDNPKKNRKPPLGGVAKGGSMKLCFIYRQGQPAGAESPGRLRARETESPAFMRCLEDVSAGQAISRDFLGRQIPGNTKSQPVYRAGFWYPVTCLSTQTG